MLWTICIPTYEFSLELVVPFLLVLPKLSFYRSFSGLRLIKSYLRNRMSDEWLSGFCTHALTSWPWNSCWQNLYNLCYQAPEEDIPRVQLLRVDFKYTVGGQGIITCIATAGRGCGVVGESNLVQKPVFEIGKTTENDIFTFVNKHFLTWIVANVMK